jgi:histidine triad (HIT) family protein
LYIKNVSKALSDNCYNEFMEESVYTKIIKGELPVHPVQPGMVLVVPKLQAETFLDLPEAEYQALWRTVKKVAARMKEVFPDKKRIGIQVEGLEVSHAHVKLIPINTGDEFRAPPDMTAEPDHAALSAMAKTLVF